jgi:hypothetical protein
MTVPLVVCALVTTISSIVTVGEARTVALYACARKRGVIAGKQGVFSDRLDTLVAGHHVSHDHRSNR